MGAAILPPEFAPIAQMLRNVKRVTRNEYSSSCPKCGGDDRFRLFVISHRGSPLGICLRHCGYIWTPESDHKPSREEIEEWRKRQIQIETARKEAAERALAILQNERLWERFHAQNNEFSRAEFNRRGIAPSWVDYCKLGLIPDYTVYSGDGSYHSPAFTIPVWQVGGVVNNIKLRIANPRTSRDRYRNYYEAGRSSLFIPLYDLPLTGSGLIVEGEFKAIVTEQTLDDINIRVVGLQSKTPAPELFEELKDLDPVYICLDPDASIPEYSNDGKRRETPVERVVRLVGRERARIVDLPCKIDDGILQGMKVRQYLLMARKP